MLVVDVSAGIALEPLPFDFSENESKYYNSFFTLSEFQDAIQEFQE